MRSGNTAADVVPKSTPKHHSAHRHLRRKGGRAEDLHVVHRSHGNHEHDRTSLLGIIR